MTGVNVGVDEARTDQSVAGIDHAIDGTLEGFADMEDVLAFVDDHAVAQQRVSAPSLATIHFALCSAGACSDARGRLAENGYARERTCEDATLIKAKWIVAT